MRYWGWTRKGPSPRVSLRFCCNQEPRSFPLMAKSLPLCLSEEKMQKWGRKKKNQLSLLFVLFLCFFVLFKITILSNGGITRSRGDDDPHSNSNSNSNPSSLPTYLTSNASTPRVANRVLGAFSSPEIRGDVV